MYASTTSSNAVVRSFPATMGLLAASLGAVLIGWLVTNDYLLFAAGFVGILAATLIVSRVYFLLWSTIIVGIVLSGLAKLYTPALQQIRWLTIPLSLILAIHALREVAIDFHDGTRRVYSPLVHWALLFMLFMVGITLINDTELNRIAVGFKGYFQVWGLFFALALIPWHETTIDKIPRVLVFVALFQIPFVLHQYLFLVPMRAGLDASRVVDVDVIAGTFGASAEGGGANALLVAFQFIVFWGLVSARVSNVISTRFLILFSIPILFPAFVNMAKVAVIYALVGFLVLFAKDMTRRPREAVLAGIGALALSSLLLTAMTLNAPEHASVQSWKDLIEFTYSYNVEQEELGDHLSRFGSLAYWADNHGTKDWFHTVFGHGLGFSRVADTQSVFQDSISVSQQGITFDLDLSQNLGHRCNRGLVVGRRYSIDSSSFLPPHLRVFCCR